MREKRSLDQLLKQMNDSKKTNLEYHLVHFSGMTGYEFIVMNSSGDVLSRTKISLIQCMRQDWSEIIEEFHKAEKLYTSKLYKALK